MHGNKVAKYLALTLLAWLLLNLHLMAMTVLGIGIYPNDFRFMVYALSGKAWLHSGGTAWLPLVRLPILIAGLVIWYRRPNLLTATLLALAGMFGGPFAVWALGYPGISLPIAAVILLPAFVVHIAWRKPVPGWLKFYFDA
ncbi:MAG: hypothetical protein K2J64_10120 [Desulfovibrio sp.]|nr:hypothetical protein [Desulfovibrio sp.]